MNEKMSLYRVYGKDDELLYVGISTLPLRRMIDHEDHAHWFCEVERITIDKVMGRRSALDAERRAISQENPTYNIFGGAAKFKSSRYVRMAVSRDQKASIKEACSHYGTTMNKVAKNAWFKILTDYRSVRVQRIERQAARQPMGEDT